MSGSLKEIYQTWDDSLFCSQEYCDSGNQKEQAGT
jgi:hypothetical protein